MNNVRDIERRHWYINGAVLLLLFVQLVFIAVLIGEIHDQDIEMAQMKRQHTAELAAAIDTPYADGAWYQQRIQQLEEQNKTLNERLNTHDS